MRIDGFAGLCPAKECVALTGLSINNTDSRGVAPCYNISPLQGFNIVIPAARQSLYNIALRQPQHITRRKQ
ncbi:MAG: hypothetical protein ACR2P4_03970 [Gammaproteobacteria bacterium]